MKFSRSTFKVKFLFTSLLYLLTRIKTTQEVQGEQQFKLNKKVQILIQIAAGLLRPDVSYQLRWSSALTHLKCFSIHVSQIISNGIFDWSVYMHKAT